MNILVVAPHPDDELIGCGGSIIKHIQSVHQVYVLYMTSGDMGNPQQNNPLISQRENEAIQGMEKCGVPSNHLRFLGLLDGFVTNNSESVLKVATYIRLIKPDLMYLPHQQDGHPDHQVTYSITLQAIEKAGITKFGEIAGEAWQTPNLLTYEVWTPLTHFEYVEDISEFIDTKISALQLHQSQLSSVDYDEAVLGLNRYRGAMTQKGKYCECFGVLRISQKLL